MIAIRTKVRPRTVEPTTAAMTKVSIPTASMQLGQTRSGRQAKRYDFWLIAPTIVGTQLSRGLSPAPNKSKHASESCRTPFLGIPFPKLDASGKLAESIGESSAAKALVKKPRP